MAPNYREFSPLLHRKRNASIASRLSEPPRLGEIFIDASKKKWKLGRCVGVGAFGEVYLASDDPSRPVGTDADFVVKVEPHNSGPSFVEMNFYIRAGKEDQIDDWVGQKKIKYLGVPPISGFGSVIIKTEKYRFIVMPRYGENIQELFLKHSKKFHPKTAFTIAWHTLSILEYIHSHGYLHLDLKGLNLLLSRGAGSPLYLVDYGLVARYLESNGAHKPYKPDNRHAEVGTLEYSSRDAHIGVMSRRSDLESLGYNLIHWMSGSLPWLSELDDSTTVYNQKEHAMTNVKSFITSLFTHPPQGLVDYMLYVSRLRFDSEPDYEYCRQLLSQGIRDFGFLDDGKITFDSHAVLKSKNKKRKIELENDDMIKRLKLKPSNQVNRKPLNQVNRKPCTPQNLNSARVTRNQVENGIKLRSSRDFDWAEILAGHPEKQSKEKLKREKKNAETPNKVDGNSNLIHDNVFDNPTPAMLKVMNRKKSKQSEKKWSRTENLTECYLTPEMKEVIAKRKGTTTSPKNRRCSRRKLVQQSMDAMYACTKF